MSSFLPPRVLLEWSATALGDDFGGYRIYRRPPRLPVAAWELICDTGVPAGIAASSVEQFFIDFTDYEAGWAGIDGPWAGGWDYALTVVNATTGVESFKTAVVPRVAIPSDPDVWITSNLAPYLNFPIAQMSQARGQDDQATQTYQAAGRDEVLTRTRLELPARRYQLAWDEFTTIGEDQLRLWRAAAASGRQMAMLLPLGDRVLGSPAPPGVTHTDALNISPTGEFYETSRASIAAPRNTPGGIALSGDSIRVPDLGALQPVDSAFTVIVAASFTNTAALAHAIAKGGITDGYAIRATGTTNQLQFFVDGASSSGGPIEDIDIWFDDDVHVAAGSSTGTSQTLYRDGLATATSSVTHGDVTSSDDFSIGAAHAGVSAPMSLNPVRAWAVYFRALTADEHLAAARYLLGYSGARMPSGAVIFSDLRDDRSWDGIETAAPIADLSGNGLDSIANSRTVWAQPWPLANIDRFG